MAMIRKAFGWVNSPALYGLDVFDKGSKSWVFTGYYPENQARKAADNEVNRGGRVHLWRSERKAS